MSRRNYYHWFFDYFVFDLNIARQLASGKPFAVAPHGQLDQWMEYVPDDEDIREARCNDLVIVGRIPIGDGSGLDRYIVLDGDATLYACGLGQRNCRLRVLSRDQTRQCLLENCSKGKWHD